jgi:phosphoketolase
MISKYTTQVFSYVPKDLKRRMKRIRKQDRLWSESRMIKEALARFLPQLEERLQARPSSNEGGISNVD